MRHLVSIFILSICASLCIHQTTHAADVFFYSGNDVLFYNPDDICGAAPEEETETSTAEYDSNEETILRYFTDKGLSLAAAAGFIGNMKQESGLEPRIIQGGAMAPDDYQPVDGTGFGLVQWTFGGTTGSRQGGLFKLSQSSGKKITDMYLQLDYVWLELNGPYKSSTLEPLKGIDNPVSAAIVIHDNYEISADSDAFVREVRGGAAQKSYDKYSSIITTGEGTVISPASTTPSCQTPDGTTTTGGLGVISGGFTFPLQTTQAIIKKGSSNESGTAIWSYTATKNTHGSYTAADIHAPTGTQIVAAQEGEVTALSGSDSSDNGFNASVYNKKEGVTYFYTHMGAKAGLSVGQTITAGSPIGKVGEARHAQGTAPHLHIDAGTGYKIRPACSRSGGCPIAAQLIDLQPLLVQAFNKLPTE